MSSGFSARCPDFVMSWKLLYRDTEKTIGSVALGLSAQHTTPLGNALPLSQGEGDIGATTPRDSQDERRPGPAKSRDD